MPELHDANLSGVRMDWVYVRELFFKDPEPSEGKPTLPEATATISLEHAIAADAQSCTNRLTIELSIPGKTTNPFVRAVVEARFSKASEKSVVDISQFASLQGPVIVMPFLRDAVATATGKSRFGQILLAPINVQSLTAQAAATAPQAAATPK